MARDARPGLHARPLLRIPVLSMLLALGRSDEFSLHVRGALSNGLSREEIKEIIMHAAIYCGVPAANHGFKLAQDVFRDIDTEI